MEDIVRRLAALDRERFFFAPVTEEVAPGYFKIVDEPMCFSMMIEKCQEYRYHTWRSFVADFELICNNAMKYNQKRSRVHKAAHTLIRAGKKTLQGAELEGRKAVTLMHPGGPQQAAADEEKLRVEQERAEAELRHRERQGLARPPPLMRKGPASAAVAGLRTIPVTEEFAVGNSEDESTGTLGGDARAPQTPPDKGGAATSGNNAFVAAAAALGRPLRDLVGAACAVINWKGESTLRNAAPAEKPESPPPETKQPPARHGPLAWRLRWMELRRRELRYQARELRKQLEDVRRRTEAATAQEEGGPAEPRSAGRATAVDAETDQAAAEGPRRKRRRVAVRVGAVTQDMARLPVFNASKDRVPGPALHELSGRGDDEASERTFMAMQHVGVRAAVLRHQLQRAFHRRVTSPTHHLLTPEAGARAPPPTRAELDQAAPSMRVLEPRDAPTDMRSRGSLRAGSSAGALPAGNDGLGGECDESMRRKRTPHGTSGYNMDDIVTPSHGVAPKFVERVRVNDIITPSARRMTDTEIRARDARFSGGRGAGARGRGRAAPARGPAAHEGSSEEDTSDEAFERRHRPLEEKERRSYQAYLNARELRATGSNVDGNDADADIGRSHNSGGVPGRGGRAGGRAQVRGGRMGGRTQVRGGMRGGRHVGRVDAHAARWGSQSTSRDVAGEPSSVTEPDPLVGDGLLGSPAVGATASLAGEPILGELGGEAGALADDVGMPLVPLGRLDENHDDEDLLLE
ncbi:unnamed protein product [Pedinophyceae sp. YPF-701]|nr:unnamed protein product [Pedinophyceae sp. YPF-701]